MKILNHKTQKAIVLSIIFLIIGSIISYLYLSSHEQVHSEILRSYGIESKIKMGLTSAFTYPVNETDYHIKCDSLCRLANNQTDIVGYHTLLLLFVILIIFYLHEMVNIK